MALRLMQVYIQDGDAKVMSNELKSDCKKRLSLFQHRGTEAQRFTEMLWR